MKLRIGYRFRIQQKRPPSDIIQNKVFCYYFILNSIVTLNRSPSRYNLNSPPWSWTRSLAIDRPSPLPSVFRETSPRMKRSVSSSAEMFKGCAEMFLRESCTFGRSTLHRRKLLCFPSHILMRFQKHSRGLARVCGHLHR